MSRTPSPAASTGQQPASPADDKVSQVARDCIDSAELLHGQKTVAINHNGLTYRLQATRLGKLILTK